MQIEQRAIDSLIPYEFNNRTHNEQQVDRIANSIQQFGFNQPIVVDEQNVILVGHGRLFAAKKLGIDNVPVLQRLGLTEVQKKAYRILDNKLQNDSTWDFNNVELELGFLEDNEFPLAEWGLDDLKTLLERHDGVVVDDEFDESACENNETLIKVGDLIELGPHRVVCGSSEDEELVELLLANVTIDLMVTDPPYGVEYDPSWRDGYDGNLGTRARGKVTNDDRIDWSSVFTLWNAPVIYCWHAGKYSSEVQKSLEVSGYEIISQIIWNKPIFVFGRDDYHWKHEPCWYAAKGNHNWQGARDQSTVWEIDNNSAFSKEKEERSGHGTQKPLEAMARPIRNNSKAGQVIGDAFLGSGTTLIAAASLGRVCYGAEIEPKYCEMIVQRYKSFCNKAQIDFKCKVNGCNYSPFTDKQTV